MKKKILIFNHSLSAGGTERVISQISNYFCNKNYIVSLFTLSGKNISDFYELDKSIKRYQLDITQKQNNVLSKIIYNLKRIIVLRKNIINYNPDIILSFIDTNNIIMILSCIGLKKKLIISERTYPGKHRIPLVWNIMRKIFYKYSNLLVVQTDRTKSWFLENIGKLDICVIPNSVEIYNKKLKKNNTIIAVGRLEYEKGFDILIRSFAKIHKQSDDWKLEIYGEGSQIRYLEKLAAQFHLTSKINFLKPIKDIKDRIASASIIVHPARYEGFPNVILEAMSAGTAVIASDCLTGPRELIDSEINGILFPVDDVNSLSNSLKLLISDEKKRNRFEITSKLKAKSFELNNIMKKWEKIINQ